MTRIKKELEPSQVIVIRDNREKRAVNLAPLKVIDGTLSTGDFSLQNYEDEITIELKTLDDFIGCVGKDRERFERELQRMRAFQVKMVVVEGTWAKIEKGDYKSQIKPQAVMGSIYSWIARGMMIHMVDTHAAAERMISRTLFMYAKHKWLQAHPFIQGAILTEPDVLELSGRIPHSNICPSRAV